MKRLLTGLVIVALTLAVPSIGAATFCSSTVTRSCECNSTFTNVTFNGGITVKDSDSCVLENVTVNGGVDMSGAGAVLEILSSTVGHGDISMSAGDTLICNSTIDGRIKVSGGTCFAAGLGSDDFPIIGGLLDLNVTSCPGNLLNGSVTAENVINLGTGLTTCPSRTNIELEGNSVIVNGAVKLNNNGSVELEGNHIKGSLFCSNNVAVFNDTTLLNTVTGQKKGQCATLP